MLSACLLICVLLHQVDGNNYMSIAKLTRRSLEKMTSRDNAPRIFAAVLHKPDFDNVPGYEDVDEEFIPQVCQACPTLCVGPLWHHTCQGVLSGFALC
jgi:hypothetical protein